MNSLHVHDDRDRMNAFDAISIAVDILPVQWLDRLRTVDLTPEGALAFALLEGACWDLQSRSGRLRAEALAWIADRGPSMFSFSQVCDGFGWDADWLRAGILRWAITIHNGGRAHRVLRRQPIVARQRIDGKRYGSRRRRRPA